MMSDLLLPSGIKGWKWKKYHGSYSAEELGILALKYSPLEDLEKEVETWQMSKSFLK